MAVKKELNSCHIRISNGNLYVISKEDFTTVRVDVDEIYKALKEHIEGEAQYWRDMGW